jgi:hypothetical protein
MKTVTIQAALHDLLGIQCPCGAEKQRRRSFCGRCYFSLPRPMRNRLYDRLQAADGARTGYEAAYSAALQDLGLESPFLKARKAQSV